MTQEEKELLIKDLCGRLPYGVKGIITYNGDKDIFTVKGIHKDNLLLSESEACNIEDFKLYLRRMSTMTEEEIKEVQTMFDSDIEIRADFINIIDTEIHTISFLELQAVFDFLNKNHFDYNELIPKGLANEAPEGMYTNNT